MAEVAQKPSLLLVRRFNASPEALWRARTDPQSLKQWMAPTDRHSVELAETDVRVGGRYRLVMKDPQLDCGG